MTDEDIESPCIKVCVIEPDNGFCRGCWRTLDEISHWAAGSPAEKLAVLESVAQRKAAAAEKTV